MSRLERVATTTSVLQLNSRSSSVCLWNVDANENRLQEIGILSAVLWNKDSRHQVVWLHHECWGLNQIGSTEYPFDGSPAPSFTVRPRCTYAEKRTGQNSSAHSMRRPRQSSTLPKTGADCGVGLPLPGCTRFVQTVACQLETPSTVPRIGPCGECTLRPLGLAFMTMTTTTILWTLHRSSYLSQHPQLKNDEFCWSKFYCPNALSDSNLDIGQ